MSQSQTVERQIELEYALGYHPQDTQLELNPTSKRYDLQPWLLDMIGLRISCLGHKEDLPRPWDWENVLSILDDREELFYILDHQVESNELSSFTTSLLIRFPQHSQPDSQFSLA